MFSFKTASVWLTFSLFSSWAWCLDTITVAIIDTGVDTNHKDLNKFLRTNTGETGFDSKHRDKRTNHIDDDHNGYVDDVYGWNFVDNNSDVTDKHGHGTHVAGLVVKPMTTKKAVIESKPPYQLLILKYFDPADISQNNMKNTVQAIRYAIKAGVQIINYSGGGHEPSFQELAAIKEAESKGIIFVAAAGNDGADTNEVGFFPANYNLSNMISVTAVDTEGRLLPSSNFGPKHVDFAAPGKNVWSTLPGGKFGPMTGTSQATALLAGQIAWMMSLNPNLRDSRRLKDQLVQSGSKKDGLFGKIRYPIQIGTNLVQ